MSIPKLQCIDISLSPTGVAELSFNRPDKYNSFTPQAYIDWLAALRWAAQTDAAKVTVLTGQGPYYTSGHALAMPDFSDEHLVDKIQESQRTITQIIDEFIWFPKLLIAAVNGHAIGVGVTTLALCDVVYAVDKATFQTPFMKLGFCAEGCSSVMFPRIMGYSKANEMLMMGRVFSAQEMEQCGFLSRVFPEANFRETVLLLAEEAAQFSLEAIKVTKGLIRHTDRRLLSQVNQNEVDQLMDRMTSKDSLESIMRFVESQKKKTAKKSKL
ncbi:ClpP/crotonase-like domain-containing protein [Radiomyces spectabilis]|uniref:ClpP/crotonase-like domain-containing protein n=1 Tax=Radiomyces spectabilis TaxID=64574 RepID=UPI00221FD228|nr:ClpP/crotonase-like domain-containing protein [Radiomyces spectabilis]KAI8384739.1 ClpP/crotonase-like domain-containing protein [Radiomyces spectabilis]